MPAFEKTPSRLFRIPTRSPPSSRPLIYALFQLENSFELSVKVEQE